jgi:hypothetical protein
MALTSPGVEVSVIDESFYTPAEPGTVPIIFVATSENKTNGAGTGIAPGTTKAKTGVPYLLTSQRDLVDTFGDPAFYTDANNNPIHGGEQNEYGLQAAYSYLGVANRAYVVRADIDLGALNASADATTANPANGTYWLDTGNSKFGIFEWDGSALSTTNTTGQQFTNKTPIVITSKTNTASSSPFAPKAAVGGIGDYAITAVSTVIRLWYKNSSGTWVQVGSADWKNSWPTVTGTQATPTFTASDSITFVNADTSLNATVTLSGTALATVVSDINTALTGTGITAAAVNNKLELKNDGSSHPKFTIGNGVGTPLTDAGITADEYHTPTLQASAHTSVPAFKDTDTDPKPTGSIWIKTTTPNAGADWKVKVWNGDTELWDTSAAPIYSTNQDALLGLDKSGGGANLTTSNLYVMTNVAEADTNVGDFTIYKRNALGATTITSAAITASTFTSGTGDFTIQETVKGSATLSTPVNVSFSPTGATTDADALAGAINTAGLTNVTASVDAANKVVITHAIGGDIRFVDTNTKLGNAFTAFNYTNSTGTANFYDAPDAAPNEYIATLWKELSYTASASAPTALAADGALWYSSTVDEIDIMVHDGTSWKGYLNEYASADPEGPIVSATEPDEQSDGSALVTGDLWISTADLENFPLIYRYNATLSSWVALDTTDQTTENGVLFADARWSTDGGTATAHDAGSITDLLSSDYLDPDAPDPALYPKGMLLWNLRRSGFNVKRFERNYIDLTDENARNGDESMAAYYPHRWVTESANEADGSGSFGRKAQRKVVIQALQSLVNSNEDIRDDESRIYNLIATPGYPELIGEMVTLNYDRGLTAFVVGDTPMRLTPDATSLNNWATNVNVAVEDNDDGLVTSDEYLGVYYPSGFTSDNAGNNVVVPASHMVLRTIALNDQVAYPWFAPAGTRRGGVTNATSTGYINGEGEFVAAALNEGQRDTLYQNNVNPITFLTGAGLVVFGQKTRARNASALDRVNVARLVIYLRSQLNTLAKPYLFEPNDKITRDEIKQQVESLLVELVGLRALFDFLVVCDETNNTPTRIDRNELYVDIAIEPVKAVEFIYIPLRLKNTGEIAGL